MFTGLVEATAQVVQNARRGPGFRLTLSTELGPLELGESISVDGACLTVAALRDDGFEADVSLETAERTTLGSRAAGDLVNLERSLELGDRLGGHLVSGHVDGLATVRAVEPVGEARRVTVAIEPALLRYIAPKGSVALDGVSLTVNAVRADGFEVMLIPHTLVATTLDDLPVGKRLNVEVDLLARYVVHYLSSIASAGTASGGTKGDDARLELALKRAGFL